jgi:hypothetical protein
MGGILDALRGGGNDAIRQSTSLTTAYLLEQNRKFEAYMREKVAALEGRVAGQQARLTSHEMEDFDDGSTEHHPEWDEGLAEVLEWPGPEDASSATYGEMSASGDAAPVPKVSTEPEVTGFDGWGEPDDEDEAPPVSEGPPDWMAAYGVADDPETGDEEAEPAVEIVQGDADLEAEDASSQPDDDLETGDEQAEPVAEIVQGDADLEIEDEEGDEPGLFDAPHWQAGEEGDPTVPVTGGVLGLTAIQDRPPEEEYLPAGPTTNGGALPTATAGMDLRGAGQSPAPATGHQVVTVPSSPPQGVSVTIHGVEDLDEEGSWDTSLPEGPSGDYA